MIHILYKNMNYFDFKFDYFLQITTAVESLIL
jgi:hypothetical protein